MQLNSKIRLFIFFIISISASQTYAYDSLRLEKSGGQYFVIHKVESGETLYSLSRRYGASLADVVKANSIENNQISLFQELRIPVEKPANIKSAPESKPVEETTTSSSTHTVAAGETLYAISRKYGVSVDELKQQNNLTSNELSVGQELILGVQSEKEGKKPKVRNKEKGKEDKPKVESAKKEQPKNTIPTGFSEYLVQSGDLLESIAARFKVRPDSIVIWNDLPNTYLSIGQKLLIRGKLDSVTMTTAENVEMLPYGQRKEVKDQSGFTKIYEEGTARKIEDVDTQKYLALHRTLPVGTLVEIRNLMNNQKIYARVVGKLPEVGLNENVLIRLTPICFERLGVIDPKTRVEVSYYKD